VVSSPKGLSSLHQRVSEAWGALSGAYTDCRGVVERTVATGPASNG
jgi:hypothetical protein